MKIEHVKNYKPKEFAELLNISVKTLQRWNRDYNASLNLRDAKIYKIA